MIRKIDHIDIRVSDLEAAERFFATLGMEVLRRMPAPRNSLEMRLPGDNQVVFEIRLKKENEPCGIAHVGFEIDAAEDVETLEQAGLPFSGKNRYVPASGRTVSNFTDTDGGKWQLTIAQKEDESNG